MNLTETVVQSGRLSDKELAALVRKLDEYDLRGLVKRPATRPVPDARHITIRLGLDEVDLSLPAEGKLPRADAKTPEGRFVGILEAVRKGLVGKSEK
jgi:hypothetical protein